MAAAENKQCVLDYLEAVSEGRRADAYAIFAEDATWQRPPSLGGTGFYEGRDAIFDVYFAVDDELFETGTREYDFEVRTAVAEGEHVAIEMHHRGRGPWRSSTSRPPMRPAVSLATAIGFPSRRIHDTTSW